MQNRYFVAYIYELALLLKKTTKNNHNINLSLSKWPKKMNLLKEIQHLESM